MYLRHDEPEELDAVVPHALAARVVFVLGHAEELLVPDIKKIKLEVGH